MNHRRQSSFNEGFDRGAQWSQDAPKALTVPLGFALWGSLIYTVVSLVKKARS